MSFRKEKKYRLTKSDFYKLSSLLNSMGMKLLHEKRQVNSIYFDTNNQQMFQDSEEGVLPRKKIRVRWYNESNAYSKETKISSIEGRYKTSINLKKIYSIEDLKRQIYLDQTYGYVYPILKVSYFRTYFTLNEMRITFDENIKYKNLRDHGCNSFYDPERVVEVKIPNDFHDDLLEKTIPYQTARFSKFCRGILVSEKQISLT